ncbi:MAG: ACT domain-containing protein [Pseudonocardiaceae bacterium]|nr:ACT domain-containing protein [Pseudonocardiaceae bacterium]
MKRLVLDLRPDEYAVFRRPPSVGVPAELFELTEPAFVSISKTPEEISVVCPARHADTGPDTETGWRVFTVRGPLEFTLTGILAALTGELAAAGVPLFTVSSFDTDHILVKADDLDRATNALREAGHEVHADAAA